MYDFLAYVEDELLEICPIVVAVHELLMDFLPETYKELNN